MDKENRLKLIQSYVANVAIGPTTLCNQETDGVADVAREFLVCLDLVEIKEEYI